jgi:hypothetical protein
VDDNKVDGEKLKNLFLKIEILAINRELSVPIESFLSF